MVIHVILPAIPEIDHNIIIHLHHFVYTNAVNAIEVIQEKDKTDFIYDFISE